MSIDLTHCKRKTPVTSRYACKMSECTGRLPEFQECTGGLLDFFYITSAAVSLITLSFEAKKYFRLFIKYYQSSILFFGCATHTIPTWMHFGWCQNHTHFGWIYD